MKAVPFRDRVVQQADDDRPAIRFEDQKWTYCEAVQAGAERAAFMLARRREGPLHVGVLLGNVPEFWFWLAAAALSGGVAVGIDPTRRGRALARELAAGEGRA
jgi:fatty-acyl-CoA synthase